MAAFLRDLLGSNVAQTKAAVPVGDSDFADFARAPDPTPPSHSTIPSAPGFTGIISSPTGAPYTAWYNVHERHSLSDFKQEGVIFACILVIVAIHLWGTSTNRAKAKAWASAHASTLQSEFALVGFGGRRAPKLEEVESEGLMKSMASDDTNTPEQLLKEKSPNEFTSYASGRQNVAFMDIRLTLQKRYSPLSMIAENLLGFVFDTMPATAEKVEAVLYPFDGKESQTVPSQSSGSHDTRSSSNKSSYDGFVWAVVNKDNMKQLRDERFDVSITTTKDNVKLPVWTTVMSESAEVTELLLTPELIKAIEQAGDLFDYLIVTDQPIDKPTTLNETEPKKRIYFSIRLPSAASAYNSTLPLFAYFVRMADQLASSAHFRPEVTRKFRSIREDTIKQLQKEVDKVKNEERELEREKAKKLKRDLELKGLDAKAQKKYLEKERDREQKKMMKKQARQ